MGTILGIISLAALAIVIFLSYRLDGNAPAGYGVTGLLSLLFSLVGLVLGIITVRQKDQFQVFPCAAIILNGLSLLLIACILYIG